MNNKIRVSLTQNEAKAVALAHDLLTRDIGDAACEAITLLVFNRFKMFVTDEVALQIQVHDAPIHPSYPDTVFLEFEREHAAQPMLYLLNNSDEKARYIHRAYSLYLNVLRTTNIGESLYEDLSQWGAYLHLCTKAAFTPRMPTKRVFIELLKPHVMNQGQLTEERAEIVYFAIKSVRDSMEFPLTRGRLILSENLTVIW